jgi:branched-chain amino acid transport system ATP-binding protein
MSALLEVSGLVAGYGQIRILNEVALSVDQGAIVALIGSNGAGKSTLLRALSGMTTPWSGAITFRGAQVTRLSAPELVRRGLVHVPEGRRLFAGLSVLDNLLLGAYLRKLSASDVRADLERVFELFPRLAERRKQDARTLSGGEQQMCAIGRGLMSGPRLLLIDELSLGLAPKVVEELIAALTRINEDGTSLLVVEQDVATALSFAHHAAVLDQGRIVAAGPSAQIADDPAVRQAYLGAGSL